MHRRRQFLRVLGYAALSVQLLPWTGCASAEELPPPDSLTLTSSRNSKLGEWAAHTHLLYIPLRLFQTPPREGVTLSTTRTYFHSHMVVLTREQLSAVARGGTVLVEASGGAHTFSVELA